MTKIWTICAAAALVLAACGGDSAADEIGEVEQAAENAQQAIDDLEASIDSLADGLGGVNREGSVREIVQSLADAGVAVDARCVTDALAEYTDEELLAYDTELMGSNPSPEAEAFGSAVLACVDS